MQNKVKESETKKVLRSSFQLSDYNPRKITPEARKALKANIKSNGLIGGLVINEQTGNLVSGHQRISIADEINKYNPETQENDYMVKVEVINVDPIKEKELNIFFNSKSVSGEFDYELLAQMVQGIDVKLAGLDDVDMSMIELAMPNVVEYSVPTYEPQADKKEVEEISEKTPADGENENDQDLPREKDNSKSTPKAEMTEEEKIAHVKNIKGIVKDGAEYLGEPYFTVSFDTFDNKVFFLEKLGIIDTQARYVKGEDLDEAIENYVDSFDDEEDSEETDLITEAEISE